MNHEDKLDGIRKELAKIRSPHAEACETYYSKKAEYDFGLAKSIHENPASTKADVEREYLSKNEELYNDYKKAHGTMEAHDRTLKNLDAQRSIIQSQMKRENS
jgi:hypothetical protein